MWIERTLGDRLERLAATRPVVMVTGARQTGKSSLLKKRFPDAEYITFDHLHHVDAARSAPERFLAARGDQTVLDEVQYVPELLRALKIAVDDNRDVNGRWLLTGSRRFDLMDSASESLAGRISVANLETLSAEEIRASDHPRLGEFLWAGGYPELWGTEGIDRIDYMESYLRTYLERDLKQIVNVRNLADFRRFVRTLAVRSGQLFNASDVARDVGVSIQTARNWTHALEMSGLVHLLPPYFANLGKRLVKTPKIFFADHGLMCHLLGIENERDLLGHPLRGNLWETFVFGELLKSAGARPGDDLFFYRDHKGIEVDFVLERGTHLQLVEAKAGERIDRRKLNFDKLEEALGKRFRISKIVAHDVNNAKAADMGGFVSFNPLLCPWPEG